MAKKTLINFSVSQTIKDWFDEKRKRGWCLSAIFGQIMSEAIAREARTGDWLAKDVPSMRLGIDDDE